MPVPQIDIVQLTQSIANLNPLLSASQNAVSNFDQHWRALYGGQERKVFGSDENVQAAYRQEAERVTQEAAQYRNQINTLQGQLKDAMSQAGLSNDVGITSLVNKASSGDVLAGQALQERLAIEQEGIKQKEQLGQYRTDVENQLFGGTGFTLAQALGSQTSELGQLSEALKKQQSGVFQQELSPLIRQQLGARGLEDSGANIELQSKALGGLERSRQGMLTQAFLGGKEQLRGLQQRDILSDIGLRQQAISQGFGLQRSGITMQFQRELMAQQAALAKELASLGGGRGMDWAKFGLGAGMLGASFIPGVGPAASAALAGGGASGIFGSFQ